MSTSDKGEVKNLRKELDFIQVLFCTAAVN